MAFHLWKVKVRARSSLDEFMRVMEEVKTEIKDTASNGFAIDDKVLLI